jgi:dGTPase
LVGPIFADVKHDFPDASESRRIHEAVRRLIGAMVNDLIEETQRRIIELNPQSVAEIHNHNQPIASFSEAMRSNDAEIKKFLLENMYRHYKLNRMTSKGRRVVKDLFSLLVDEPGCLPSEWQKKVGSSDKSATAQIVADFVGGMTDRFALDEHRKLFDLQSRIS